MLKTKCPCCGFEIMGGQEACPNCKVYLWDAVPAAPGPSYDDFNIMELCFHNGEAHMKEKMVAKLRALGDSMSCVTIAQAVKIVEDL